MIAKVLLVCAAAALVQGLEYPPGINPALCPNYPICDMELLAHYTPRVVPTPGWPLGYEYAPIPHYPLAYARMVAPVAPVAVEPTVAPAVPPAIEYPADVDPASCPNYPYCA